MKPVKEKYVPIIKSYRILISGLPKTNKSKIGEMVSERLKNNIVIDENDIRKKHNIIGYSLSDFKKINQIVLDEIEKIDCKVFYIIIVGSFPTFDLRNELEPHYILASKMHFDKNTYNDNPSKYFNFSDYDSEFEKIFQDDQGSKYEIWKDEDILDDAVIPIVTDSSVNRVWKDAEIPAMHFPSQHVTDMYWDHPADGNDRFSSRIFSMSKDDKITFSLQFKEPFEFKKDDDLKWNVLPCQMCEIGDTLNFIGFYLDKELSEGDKGIMKFSCDPKRPIGIIGYESDLYDPTIVEEDYIIDLKIGWEIRLGEAAHNRPPYTLFRDLKYADLDELKKYSVLDEEHYYTCGDIAWSSNGYVSMGVGRYGLYNFEGNENSITHPTTWELWNDHFVEPYNFLPGPEEIIYQIPQLSLLIHE